MKDIFDSIDQAIEMNEKLSSENNRLTMALQEIRELESDMDSDISVIVREALEGEK